jgi:hypothetical protein
VSEAPAQEVRGAPLIGLDALAAGKGVSPRGRGDAAGLTPSQLPGTMRAMPLYHCSLAWLEVAKRYWAATYFTTRSADSTNGLGASQARALGDVEPKEVE